MAGQAIAFSCVGQELGTSIQPGTSKNPSRARSGGGCELGLSLGLAQGIQHLTRAIMGIRLTAQMMDLKLSARKSSWQTT